MFLIPRSSGIGRAGAIVVLALALLGFGLVACGRADVADDLAGTWRLDRARSTYAGTAEARVDETFTCSPRGAGVACEIVGVRIDGDTTRASFVAIPDAGPGQVTGVAGANRVLLMRRENGYDAVFLDRAEPVLGYRITPYADSLVVRATDPATGELLTTRVVYTREE